MGDPGYCQDIVQAVLQYDDSHLRFYMLSRARKTHVREKLKEKVLVSKILLVADIILTNFRPLDLYQYKQLELKSNIEL